MEMKKVKIVDINTARKQSEQIKYRNQKLYEKFVRKINRLINRASKRYTHVEYSFNYMTDEETAAIKKVMGEVRKAGFLATIVVGNSDIRKLYDIEVHISWEEVSSNKNN